MQFKRSIFGYQDMGVGAIRETPEEPGDGSEATIVVTGLDESKSGESGKKGDTLRKKSDRRTRKGNAMRASQNGRVNWRIASTERMD